MTSNLAFKMAISRQRIVRSTSGLILGWSFRGRWIEWTYFRLHQIQDGGRWWRHHVISFVATSALNILETKPDSGMVPMDSLQEFGHGLSIAHVIDDVTWPDDVIMVTSWFFFKMLLLRQLLSELDDILTQCSCIRCVYMVFTDNWSGPYDVIDDVIR